MTDEHKTTDYSELLSRAENETHRSGMWADTCLLIDELSATIRSLIAERDEAHRQMVFFGTNEAIKDFVRLKARADAAEARAAEYEKALAPLAKIDCPNNKPGDPLSFAFDPWSDGAVVFGIGSDRTITAGDLRRARAALARKGEG